MRYKLARPYLGAFASPFRTLEVCCSRASRVIPAIAPRFPVIRRALQTSAVPRSAVTPHCQEEMVTVNTTSRLAALRSLMKERKVDIYGTDATGIQPRMPLAQIADLAVTMRSCTV